MRRTTAISLVCGAAVVGLALGVAGLAAAAWWLVVGFAAAAAILWPTRWRLPALLVLALVIGVWRAGDFAVSRSSLVSLIGQKVSVSGVVADDPAYAAGKTGRPYMNFKLDELRINGRAVPGQLSVYMYQTNLHRGWRVAAAGKVAPGFGNMPAELSYPTLTVISRAQSPLEQARQRFFAGMRTALPEPLASFALGLLVGIRALIPKGMQAQLTAVGLSHLVAVSGYNLTIIVAAASRILRRAGRGVTLVACFWLIGAFLVVTGASASIVRASLVAVLSLIAAFYGRRFEPLSLILLSAAATALFNPAYLTDLGWLLSFLAFFGIMILAPAVSARLHNPRPLIAKLFIETTSAQLMTLPLILYIFGNLSPAAPLANLLILPLVPLAMLVSFVAGLAGTLAPAFAGWLAWPASLLLTAMLKLIAALAALPGGGINYRISVWIMLAAYGLILAWLIVFARRPKR